MHLRVVARPLSRSPHSRVWLLHQKKRWRRERASRRKQPLHRRLRLRLLLPGFFIGASGAHERKISSWPNGNNSTTHPRPLAPNTIPPKARTDSARGQAGRQERVPRAVLKRRLQPSERKLVFYTRRARRGPCIIVVVFVLRLGAKLVVGVPALALATFLGTVVLKYHMGWFATVSLRNWQRYSKGICDWREWRESCVASWADCYPGS